MQSLGHTYTKKLFIYLTFTFNQMSVFYLATITCIHSYTHTHAHTHTETQIHEAIMRPSPGHAVSLGEFLRPSLDLVIRATAAPLATAQLQAPSYGFQ